MIAFKRARYSFHTLILVFLLALATGAASLPSSSSELEADERGVVISGSRVDNASASRRVRNRVEASL